MDETAAAVPGGAEPSVGTLDAVRDSALRKRLDGSIRVDKSAVLSHARAEGHGSWFGRWLKTNLGPGKLTPDEFLYYGLYDTALSEDALARYAGKSLQTLVHNRCNDARWFAVAHNKLLLHQVLRGAGIAHPDLQGARLHGGQIIASSREASTSGTFRQFLETATYPMFAKPIEGMFSVGAMRVDGYRDGSLLCAGGKSIPVNRFEAYADAIDERGYLFQNLLRPSRAWAEHFGPGLPAVRVMALLTPGEPPEIHRATIKLPAGAQEADNFWREGNVLSAVDVKSGTLGPVVAGVGHERVRTDIHPDSGATLTGTRIDGWEEALTLVREAAVLIPGVRTQGWDVCLTDAGPVLLELNFGGDLNLHQLSHGEGMLTDRFCAHLRACGYKKKLPAAVA